MTPISEADVAGWRSAIGRTETFSQRLEVESLRRYALAVGSTPDVERELPPLAHWAFFLPEVPDSAIDVDGHAKRGTFLPRIPLQRRMFASSAIRFVAPLIIEAEADQMVRIADVTHKAGQSGDLVFVDVERIIAQKGSPRVIERQTLVYRDAGGEAPTPMPVPAAKRIEGEIWQPSTANLFRFSAVTFNSHRIHYDAPFAVQVEGYPALVVHGPFTAAKLAAFAAREGALASFTFRAQAPLFLGQPIRFQRGEGEVRAVRCDGAVATFAKVTYQ